ncbi:cysteine ABC transporter permease [Ureibacillus massiliensis 4400831 = CIP 108448 = CCUG 49529]|uniref:Cysteine ABC transporter permease n=1 Tax=Ureibacillus massiliensis 4400831 = CIP 108448 = CCUG 49529 TaxID=1211035 RepID=A0A0A3J3B2_9BACL|nr:amino acid ABC transporter permease [Ureibacillus massiliensis]KGR91524.1 cysteine ABC transporter permease [Ureibacillus massiliensis 4400831 = CIP 108448 = CCUG 49529]
MSRELEIVLNSIWPLLKAGLAVTIPLSLISFAIALVIAVITALVKLSNFKILKFIFSTYVWIFRGTPLLVQLFLVFYGLPKAGITLDPWVAAIITFSLNTGAYASESIRASILSIPKGQWEAAESLGMTYWQLLRRVIAPQTIRISLPPVTNDFIDLVKGTSLAASITIAEMFMIGQQIVAFTYEPLAIYSLVAVLYLIFVSILTIIQGKLEKYASKYI